MVTGVSESWTPGDIYHRGDRVLFGGLPYEAKWTTKDEPWKPLFTIPGEPKAN